MIENEILCTKSHEFIYKNNGFYYIGATNILINKLGKVHTIEIPEIGENYTKGEIFGYLESENAACELFMPVTGQIKDINKIIIENPDKLNSNSNIKGNWLIMISTDYFDEDKIDLICYNKYKYNNN